MWKSTYEDVVTVSLSQQQMTCCWITRSSSGHSTLKDSKVIPLERLEYEQSTLFSPVKIGSGISSFLSSCNVRNAPIYLSISGPRVVESLVNLPVSSPNSTDFPFPKLQSLLWDYRYLYPSDNARFTFYVCGVPRQLLFQYQLLAVQYALNLVAITTERMALFHLYRHIKGPAFRVGQLAQDMKGHGNQLNTFFSQDMLRRVVFTSNGAGDYVCSTQELSVAIGLSLMGEDGL